LLGIFKIGSHELFSWSDFEPLSLLMPASWVVRITGLQMWATPAQWDFGDLEGS
jgi:hypothetical protein